MAAAGIKPSQILPVALVRLLIIVQNGAALALKLAFQLQWLQTDKAQTVCRFNFCFSLRFSSLHPTPAVKWDCGHAFTDT